MCTSTKVLCQWGFRYAQDTGNKYFEAKGSILEKCFLPTEQYLLVYHATWLFTIHRLGDHQYIK